MSPSFTTFKWNNFADSPSEPYRVRATNAVECIDWNALCTIAAEAWNIQCNIGERYGLGGCHVVREVVFEDDHGNGILPPLGSPQQVKTWRLLGFPAHVEEIASSISKTDKGPFRLVHPDYGHSNIIVDDDFNILSVIDRENSFVAPSEMAPRFPKRHQIYPDAIFPLARDSNGRVIDEGWRENVEKRDLFLALVDSREHELGVSLGFSTDMISIQDDILFLIRMWEHRMPWIYKYQPGVEDGIEAIIRKLREESAIKQ